MSETRATIRTRVQRYVGTAIDATINQAIKDAHKFLQKKHNYKDMECTATISVSSGDTTFTLPSDFKAISTPEMSDTDGTGYQRMKGIIKNGIESRNTDDEGRPLMFRIWKGTGYLYAKANEDFTFQLEYYQWLEEPPTDDDMYDGAQGVVAVYPTTEDLRAQNFLNLSAKYLELRAVEAGFRRLGHERRADKYADNELLKGLAYYERLSLQNDDIDNALSGIDLIMEMPG